MRRARNAEKWIVTGTTLASVGIALCLTELRDLGGTVALVGLSVAIVGLHRFGRSGPPVTALKPGAESSDPSH